MVQMQAVKLAWSRLTYFTWVSILIVVWAALFIKFAPSLEAYIWPVLSNIKTVSLQTDGKTATFALAVDKLRPCRLVSTAWSAVSGLERVPIDVTVLGVPATGRPYVPTGDSILGPYRALLPPDFASTDKIEALLYYSCHSLWLVEQLYGPVEITPKAKGAR